MSIRRQGLNEALMRGVASVEMGVLSEFKSSRSSARRRQHGVAMVEFALVAPTAFLILLGMIVVGITVANQNLLTDGVRDSARAAAVCGGFNRDTQTQLPPPKGGGSTTVCSWANFNTYVAARLSVQAGAGAINSPSAAGHPNCQGLPNGSGLVCLYDPSNAAVASISVNPLDDCQRGYKIGVSSGVAQPLYFPLIGKILGNNGSTTTRTLTADAEATCEQ